MSVSFANQLTPNNAPTNTRAVIDANLVQTVALPAASAVANTNAIDLQESVPYPTTETINVQIIVGASTNTANSKNVTAVLQHTTANTDGTANSAAWANSAVLATPLVRATDNAGGGFAATSTTFKLPPGEYRFIRAQFATEANGGTPNGTGTIQLLF